MSAIDEMLSANDAYARTFDRGRLPLPPARRTAILPCMDARIIPSPMLSLQEGDAQVIREKVRRDLGQDTGEFDFLPFRSLDDSVREDVEFLLATQLLDPATMIRGFVYDVHDGRLREVPIETPASTS